MNKMRSAFRVYLVFVFASGIVTTSYAQANDSPSEALATAALGVLQTNCNTCHARQNPGKVFTRLNMERYADKIYKQVFIKRRMPKGKENQLGVVDENTLLQWLQQYPRKP